MGLNTNTQLRFFDLFSGIGGFRLGLERAGFKCVGYCEIDDYAAKLYKSYFDVSEEKYFKDATEIKTEELPDFDILCAGFPCQSFSIAGKRKGFEDSRGTMFFEIVRILKDKRPRYFILENVKGLLNHDCGKTFQKILKFLSDLGYTVEWQLLNSKFFSIPQNRERVFIVGCYGKECAGKIFPIKGITDETVGKIRKHPLTSKNAHQGSRVYNPDGLGSCLIANAGSGKTGLYFINKPRFDKYKGSDTVETLKVGGDTPHICVKNGTKKGYDEAILGDGINLAYPKSKTRRGRVCKGCSQTLDTNCNIGLIDNFSIRRLTPLECFRLQGFPDEIVQVGKKLGLADGHLYKMAGNAVTVNVVETIAKKLAEVDNAST